MQPELTQIEKSTLYIATGETSWKINGSDIITMRPLNLTQAKTIQSVLQDVFKVQASINSLDKNMFQIVLPRHALTTGTTPPEGINVQESVEKVADALTKQIKPLSSKDQEMLEEKFKEIDEKIARNAFRLNRFRLLKNRFNFINTLSDHLPGTPKAVGKYEFIKCPEATAVKIASKDGEQVLHANHIQLDEDQNFICTQAPLLETQELFWKAVLQHTNFILDLTYSADKHKYQKLYFPEKEGDRVTIGSIQVEYIKGGMIEKHENITLNKYKVIDTSTQPPQEKFVFRLHYGAWKDFGTLSVNELKQFIVWFNKTKRALANLNTPLIHCGAGIGRTGTATLAITIYNLISKGKITADNYRLEIDKLLLKARLQRNKNLVETPEQYESLFDLARTMLNKSAE